MRFIQTYKSPNVIGIGDNVRYKNKSYQVLINYIKGETDVKGYTPESNRTILIDDNDYTFSPRKAMTKLNDKKL